MNAGVSGLSKRLVPIAATTVRICEYAYRENVSQLMAATLLAARRVETFADDTNRLPPVLGLHSCQGPTGPGATVSFYWLTFVNNSQRVDVEADDACGGEVSNGQFSAERVATWFDEVVLYVSR